MTISIMTFIYMTLARAMLKIKFVKNYIYSLDWIWDLTFDMANKLFSWNSRNGLQIGLIGTTKHTHFK